MNPIKINKNDQISTLSKFHFVSCKVAVPLIKCAIKDVRMTKNGHSTHILHPITQEKMINTGEISAIHVSRSVWHTKKSYATFVQQL